MNESINQSINQSISQSMNQSKFYLRFKHYDIKAHTVQRGYKDKNIKMPKTKPTEKVYSNRCPYLKLTELRTITVKQFSFETLNCRRI